MSSADTSPGLRHELFGHGRLVTAVWLAAIAIHVSFFASLHDNGPWRIFSSEVFNVEGTHGYDFRVIPHAGWAMQHGENPYAITWAPGECEALYLPGNPDRSCDELGFNDHGKPFADLSQFRYLPGIAQTFGVVASWVDFKTGYWIWVCLIEVLFLIGLATTWRLIGNPKYRRWVCWTWLTASPLFAELWLGQFTLLVGVLFMLGVVALSAGKRVGFVFWTLAAGIKLFPAAFGLRWLLQRRIAGLAFAAVVGFGLVAWFFFHPDIFQQYREMTAGWSGINTFHASNPGGQAAFYFLLAGEQHFLSREAWDVWSKVWQFSLLAVVVAVVAKGARLEGERGTKATFAAAAGLLVIYPLLSKWTWDHSMNLVLPACTLLVVAVSDDPKRVRWVVLTSVFVLFPSLVMAITNLTQTQIGTDEPLAIPRQAWPYWLNIAFHWRRPLGLFVLLAFVIDHLWDIRGRGWFQRLHGVLTQPVKLGGTSGSGSSADSPLA